MKHVEVMLDQLKETGLTAKPKKCQFAMRYCSYLGHVVGRGEIKVDSSKTEAVQHIQLPKTKMKFGHFLG